MSDDPAKYGDAWAEIFDERHTHLDPSRAVETLVKLAGNGPALELGIGTGRVALPLASRGIEVHGIDASKAMVAKLREKSGGAAIPVTIGDFADVSVAGQYALIFVVFNTIFSLLTQDDQVRCFSNVARHLAPDGTFVIEAFVPNMKRFDQGQSVRAIRVTDDGVLLDASRADFARQRIVAQQISINREGFLLTPVELRYAWPSELDLMAKLAGLRLRDRWADWEGREFNSSSAGHVSLYELAK